MDATPETPEELRNARRDTCAAIADMAARKHTLEVVRKDRDASASKVMDAARAYRHAETCVQDMVNKEAEVITRIVILRASEVVPTDAPE